jgi:hypothetical protein
VPAKVNIGALLRKHLGKEAGDAVGAKIDKMIIEKRSAAQIEGAIRAELTAYIAQHETAAISAKLFAQVWIRIPIATNKPTVPPGSILKGRK